MSLNHVTTGGRKDISLDVKDINCTSITINSDPIQSFDQDLNTTSDVMFNKVKVTSTMFTDPQDLVTRQYVDDSAPGLGSLQVAYDGGNTILTQPGFPIEISGPEGITVTKTVFADPQDLVTRQYVDSATPSVTLQDAYDNGNIITTISPLDIQGDLNSTRINSTELTVETCTISNPATNDLLINSDNGNGLISLNAQIIRNLGLFTCVDPGFGTGINMNSQEIITDKNPIDFTNPNELISKRYVDDSIGSIPNTSLQSAYNVGKTIIATAGPVDIVGDLNVSTLNATTVDSNTVVANVLNSAGSPSISTNSSITTSKLTFIDPQELVSRQYVDDAVNSVSSPFTYFRGNANVTATVYEDTFVRLIWDSLNSQPKWLRKSAVTGSWIDAGIQLTHEPLAQEFITNTDDISTAINTEFYFTDSGSLNSNFDMSNYGNFATTWITPEDFDVAFPAYLSRWVLGSRTGCLTVSIEKMI